LLLLLPLLLDWLDLGVDTMSSAALSHVTRRHELSADGPSSAVPASLLAELQSVSERVAKVVSEESHKLALERVALEAEKSKQAERLAEEQFALRRDHHALAAGQLELRRVAEMAAAVGGYQQQRIRLMVGTTPFTAAAPTLCERAPNSVLAQLVKGRLAEHEREHVDVGRAESEPIEIFVDREPSVVHWLLRWLREGPPAVASLPQHTLRLLLAEARHWGVGELATHCVALLGAPGATDEGVRPRLGVS
jgi:hypothetical protein